VHVIVEGCDGTGKSTLCRLLAMATGWPTVHQGPRPPRSMEDYNDMVVRALMHAREPNMISDRWPTISNHCYEAQGNRAELEEIVWSLRLARVDRIIHCDVDHVGDLRIEARAGDEQDEAQTGIVLAKVELVLAAYRVVMDELRAAGFHVERCVMIGGQHG
jgi:hypothetical protein